MTDIPTEKPVEDVAEDVLADDPADPEEYQASEREQVSADTGTVYDATGQADETPLDLPVEDEEE
ncbi:hypothetical protein [Nocardioides pantholopis]|uniref:hypothetical protein n=1 Tax=Nocardioides pantholopis TaxID=2483798 RepID=UPI000F077F0E|nr:hypothetical protein [Nocardioides pantholopis]